MKPRFPISFGGETWLHNDRCDYCVEGRTSPGFVFLSVGANQDYARDDVVDLTRVEAMVSLGWQQSREVRPAGTGFQVVADTAEGQCTLNFCSTACLRAFLNACVDHLEELIAKAESEQTAASDGVPPAEP